MAFDENKYRQEFNKKNYRQFKVDLKTEEYDKLNKKLEEKQMTKATFLRKAIEKLENDELI